MSKKPQMDTDQHRLVPKLRFPEFRDAGEWEEKPFSKLFDIGSGKDYKHLSHGDIPVYGTGGYMLSVDDYLHDGESACIGRKGTINKPMFLSGKFWTVDTLFYTHSFKNCLPKFIYLLFQNINWLRYNEAGGVPSLSKVIINKIEVAIPPSIKEQQKIADCLSSLDELIILQSQKVEALKAHKKGLMQQLFPAEGETVPRLRFPEFRDAGEWEERRIDQVCEKPFSGGTPATTKQEYYGGKIPFIRSAEIDKNRTELFLTKEGLENSSAKLVKKGDVLVALYGANSGDVGLCAIDGAINQAVLCLRSKASNSFLYQYLLYKKQEIITKYLQGGQGNLSGDIIKSVEQLFPLPKEQQKIANCLSSLDELISLQSQKVDALKAHKKGLMQQLFPSLTEEEAP